MKKYICIVLSILMITLIYAKESISVNVLNSTVKGEPVEGAEIIFENRGKEINAGKTDIHGRLVIKDGIFGGIDDSSVMIKIKKEGYATLEARGPFNGLTFALSKEMKELEGYRIVLTWDNEPKDIDSHLVFEGNSIFFSNKTGEKANLDVDDTDGYGPETTTIEKTLSGTKYIYAVHDYTNMVNNFSEGLSESNAKVIVYIGSTQIETFYIPQGRVGNLWVLFSINGYDNIEIINKFTTTNSLEETNKFLADVLENPDILNKKIEKDAIEMNRFGEKKYHDDKIDEAINYYKKSLKIKPDYAQAYSNLGLAYQKQGKLAEAIWANREAISKADGTNKNVVKASSFYNIAKIFESREQWEDALQNYEWALENKEHDAYKKGIDRMKEKLNIK